MLTLRHSWVLRPSSVVVATVRHGLEALQDTQGTVGMRCHQCVRKLHGGSGGLHAEAPLRALKPANDQMPTACWLSAKLKCARIARHRKQKSWHMWYAAVGCWASTSAVTSSFRARLPTTNFWLQLRKATVWEGRHKDGRSTLPKLNKQASQSCERLPHATSAESFFLKHAPA